MTSRVRTRGVDINTLAFRMLIGSNDVSYSIFCLRTPKLETVKPQAQMVLRWYIGPNGRCHHIYVRAQASLHELDEWVGTRPPELILGSMSTEQAIYRTLRDMYNPFYVNQQ